MGESPTVDPLPGLAPWMGGKRRLAKRIVPLIEAVPHRCYVEPFVGMGGVFLRRRRVPPCEVVNDRHREVVNLFRVVQRHEGALLAALRWRLASRAEFERLLRVEPDSVTDVDRAARFYLLQRLSFGGRAVGQSFNASPSYAKSVWGAGVRRQIERAHRRLERVTIECLPYQEVIARYDRPTTLFYLDPPYPGSERLYGRGLFEPADFARLAEHLAGIRGRFILSLGDGPEMRRLFARFAIEAVPVTYNIRTVKPTTEIIVTGGRGCEGAPRGL